MKFLIYYLFSFLEISFKKVYSIVKISYWKLKNPNLKISFRSAIGPQTSLTVIKGARVTIGKIVMQRGASIFAETNSVIEIGDKVYIGHYSMIVARNRITIGEGTQIAEFVTIRDQNHLTGLINFSCSPVEIGKHVWLGAKVTITENVRIGDKCIVGAHSFVNKSFDEPALIAGIPAKIIRTI